MQSIKENLEALNSGKFVKVKQRCVFDLDLHEKEVDALLKLRDSGLVPKIYDSGIINIGERYYVTFIVMENCGMSLLEKYIPKMDWYSRGGPGGYIKAAYKKEKLDDLAGLPGEIDEKVRNILYDLIKFGIVYEDIHPGNFLIDQEGIVRVTDFECYSLIKN